MDGGFRWVVGEVVGLAEGEAALHAAAGHPDGEDVGVMVSAERFLVVDVALAERSAAELAAPDDQRVVEQAALLQVFDQRGARLVGVAALDFKLRVEIAMMIPAGVEALHEADAALDSAAADRVTSGP